MMATRPEERSIPALEIPSRLLPTVSESYPLDLLDNNQLELLTALRDRLPSAIDEIQVRLTPKEWKWCTNECLYRFLTATNWNIDQAVDRLVNTLLWRNEYQPDRITADEVAKEAESGKQMISGFDKEGHPIMYLVPQRENTKDYDSQLRYVVWGLEKIVKIMPRGVHSIVIVIDYENIGVTNAPPIAVSKRFLQILGDHYPCTLHKAFMINPSWYISIFFRFLRPFLDPITAAKINLVDLTQEKKRKQDVAPEGLAGYASILDYIDEDQLFSEYGGSRKWIWNFDVYWNAINQINDYQ
jgi:hypothetical protein